MRRILFFIMTIGCLQSNAQLLVNLQLPPNSVMQKSQLWNLVVTNTSTSPVLLHIELMFSDANTSMQILSATTKVFTISPGTMQLNNAVLQPIQYNVLNTAFSIDATPNGLLPVGDFEVCFSFMKHQNDGVEKIAEECQELIIEPISPAQLVSPFDESVIETKNPQLTWLPPMPVSLFNNLNYDLDLVEVFTNQTPADAIQQNVPIFHQQGIKTTTILYPVNAPPLELNKQYAWRVIVKNNEMTAGQSDTWVFTIKEFGRIDKIEYGDLPFAKLKKEDGGEYAIFIDELKFDYLNENADTAWNITVYDLSSSEKKQISLVMDSIPLKPGQNLVKYNLHFNSDFVDKHLYILEVINSRKESWRLKFDFRKSED